MGGKLFGGTVLGDRSWVDEVVPRTPTSVVEALSALEAVTARLLAEGDRRAAFPDIYAIITRRVAETVALGPRGMFIEPRWISRLAGRFCERYLTTLRWSLRGEPQDAGAWSIAYGCCELDDMLPVHHVLLGLSAHINYDLALGVAANITELGGADDPIRLARYKHDHDAVNHLLRASVPEAFDHLIERHQCPGARALYRHAFATTEWIAMALLETWRERVWGDAMALLRARGAGERRRVVDRIEQRSRRHGRLLALPGILPFPGDDVAANGRAQKPARTRTAARAEQLFHALS